MSVTMTMTMAQTRKPGLSISCSKEPKARDPVKAKNVLPYNSPHQQYWYQTVGYALSRLLDNAGYNQQSQMTILGQFATHIAPYLGPAREPAIPPQWKSFMTDDHSPIELSWDFHTGVERPTIRYSIEPISSSASKTTTATQHRQAAVDFKQNILKALPDSDTTWFYHFESWLHHSWGHTIPEGHPSTIFWAFDLGEKATTAKAYFFPGAVAQAKNQSTLSVITDALKAAPGFGSSSSSQKSQHEEPSAYKTFTNFVDLHPSLRLEVDMLALDLVDPDKSRIKIYCRDRRTDFYSVRQMMSLGGQIRDDPDFDRSMRKLRRLWDALLGMEGVSENTPLPHNGHRTAGILYNVEFRVNSKVPKVKVYIPVRHYAKSDGKIVATLTRFFDREVRMRRPLNKTAQSSAVSYAKCMAEIFRKRPLAKSLGVHTYIGCSVQSEGNLRVVAYINAQDSKLRNKTFNEFV